MNKIFKFLIASIAVISLSACGNNASNGDKVELTVWGDTNNQSMNETAFKKINEEFEKENPNIKVNYQYSGTLDSINVALQSDSLPDLFWVQGNKSTKMAEMAKNGYLLAIDGLDYSRFSEDEIGYATVDGEVYCSLTSFISYVTYYYNKDIFDKYNLDVPKTFDEFENIVEKLKENNVTPIALGGNGDFDRYWFVQSTAASLATKDINSIVEDKDTASFNELKEVFQNLYDFSKDGAFGKDFLSMDGNGAKLLFTNGNAAMIPDGTWNNASFLDSGVNIGTFTLPGKDGKTYAQTGPSNINTYAISAKTKYPDQAKKYIEFLNSKEAEQIIADEVGEVPMIDDIKARDGNIGNLSNFDEIGSNIYNRLSEVATKTSKPQDLFLTTLLPELMQGKINADEAINLLKEELAK